MMNANVCTSLVTGKNLPVLWADLTRNTANDIDAWISELKSRVADVATSPPYKPRIRFVWLGAEHREKWLSETKSFIKTLEKQADKMREE
jgi:hypothetical protein